MFKQSQCALLFAGALAIASAGCSGDKGPAGPAGPQGPAGPGLDGGAIGSSGALTAESCAVCHGANKEAADAQVAHQRVATTDLARYYATITDISVPGDGRPVVTFNVSTAPTGGTGVAGLNSFAFTLARLDDAAAGGGVQNWRSYLNRLATGTTDKVQGATEVSAGGRSATTVAGQLSGTLTDNTGGSYTYRFGNALTGTPAATTPRTGYGVVTVPYDPARVLRVGLMSQAPIAGPGVQPASAPAYTAPGDASAQPAATVQPVPTFDAAADVVPANGTAPIANPRQLVRTETCNTCHQKLAAHGERRLSVEYCVTCHNPSSTDSAGTTIDLKQMIHALHMGKSLPSVNAGAPYVIKSPFGDQDYSNVSFPRMTFGTATASTSDPGDCLACHGAAKVIQAGVLVAGPASALPAQPDAWRTRPTIAACTSCHDRTTFALANPPAGFTIHKGNLPGITAPYDESQCAGCHTSAGSVHSAPIETFHNIPDFARAPTALPNPAAAPDVAYRINSATVGADKKVTVNLTVSTRAAPTPVPLANAYRLNASGGQTVDPFWAQTASGNSRLFVDVGWATKAATAAAQTNYDNAGSGQKAGQPMSMDVLKDGVFQPNGSYTVTSATALPPEATGVGVVTIEGHPASADGNRLSVTSATKPFAITGTAATARRAVVDVNKCNVCHGTLTLHGNNRTNNIDTCAICHNANATDVGTRPAGGASAAKDAQAEQSVEQKTLIHGIHGAGFSGKGPFVYGFRGSENDFRDAGYPGYVANCEACHNPGTYSASIPTPLGVTTSTGADATKAADFKRTTAVTATCQGCHTSSAALGHMRVNGAGYGMTQAEIDALNQ